MASCPYLISKSTQTHCQDKSSKNQGAGKVDCPVRKHNVMHAEQVTCSGCAATQMSELRRHLSQSRHNRYSAFLRQCRRCKTTVVDRIDWARGLHAAGECEYKPAPRESIVTAWARLYLILYPYATRVPNPYTDERGWLPDTIVSFIRSPHTETSINDNTANHHPLTSELSTRREAITLATDVDNFMPSPAHSEESTGSNTPDSPSMPLSLLNLISSSEDDKHHGVERVQDYLRSQLNLMPVQEYAAIDTYLGNNCNVDGDEMDSAYGSMDMKSAQLRTQDRDDARTMAKIDPWSRYNTRLDHTNDGVMLTPEEVQTQKISIKPTESPSALSLQPSESSSLLETSIYESASKIKPEERGDGSFHSYPSLLQPRGERIPIVEAYMNATQARWDLTTYTRQWLNFIERWDRIIEEMGNQGSTTTRDAFAQVLQSIRIRVPLDNNNLPLFADHQGQQSHTTQGNQGDGTPSRKKRARTEETTKSIETGKKRAKGAGGSEADDENRVLVDQDDRIAETEFLKFHCPVWMHHVKHNRPRTCRQWTGNELSQLHQRHLNPCRAGGHCNWIKFFERCDNCKEFVKDEHLWERHQRRHCKWQDTAPRRRKANNIYREDEDFILAAWARIYLTFFPEDLDVPNPYVGQSGDIPRYLTKRFREQVNATLPPLEAGPFLDDQQGGTAIPHLPTITNDDINRHAAAEIMMNDFIDPSTLMLDPASPRPALSLGSLSHDASPGLLVTSPPRMANQFDFDFKTKLDQGIETTFNAIDDASNCLTPIALERLLAQVQAQFHARVEACRNMRRPAGIRPAESTAIFPILNEPNHLLSYAHGQVAASESSTQPSTQATKTQAPSTNLTSLDDTEINGPRTPPPQTAAFTDSPHYPLKDMGAMGKELDQLATRDTQFAGTSLPDGYGDVDSFLNFDSA